MNTRTLALVADNGLLVCVEEAGEDNIGVVHARTPQENKGVWETLTRHDLGGGQVALSVTSDKDGIERFLSAQPDGTIRGNRVLPETESATIPPDLKTAIGAWEIAIEVPLEDGRVAYQYLTGYLSADEGLPQATLVANRATINAWEMFTPLYDEAAHPGWDGDWPTLDARTAWAGAFCIPDAIPGSPWGDGRRIWTPAYGCYDEAWRDQIRAQYARRGYRHFVYNCAGLPYGSHYPELADDPDRVARDLDELLGAGLIPVVCATDDRRPDDVLSSFAANDDRIPITFPVWEMNGPLKNDTDRQKRVIEAVRTAAPKADCYLHFTPGHGAIGVPEDECWRWCQAAGTLGLLAQGGNAFPPEDPVAGGQGLESTAVRLAGLTTLGAPPAWAGLYQLTVKFEYGVWGIYNGAGTEEEQIIYSDLFLEWCPNVIGFCDGGTPLAIAATRRR